MTPAASGAGRCGYTAIMAVVVPQRPSGGRPMWWKLSARVVAAFALVPLLASGACAQELVVSGAVSLKEAVEELGREFAAGRPGVTMRYNFGASGDLQKQIEAGGPGGLFVFLGAPPHDETSEAWAV